MDERGGRWAFRWNWMAGGLNVEATAKAERSTNRKHKKKKKKKKKKKSRKNKRPRQTRDEAVDGQ